MTHDDDLDTCGATFSLPELLGERAMLTFVCQESAEHTGEHASRGELGGESYEIVWWSGRRPPPRLGLQWEGAVGS